MAFCGVQSTMELSQKELSCQGSSFTKRLLLANVSCHSLNDNLTENYNERGIMYKFVSSSFLFLITTK